MMFFGLWGGFYLFAIQGYHLDTSSITSFVIEQPTSSNFEGMALPAAGGRFSGKRNRELVVEHNLIERTELNECQC